MDGPPVPAVIGDRGGGAKPQRIGHDKRKDRNALPVAFLLYLRQSRVIVGAAVFVAVYKLTSQPSDVFWAVSRGVELAAPFALDPRGCKCISSVFSLKAEYEASVRQAQTLVNHTMLGSQFPEFESMRFRCIAIDTDVSRVIFDTAAASVYVRTPASYIQTSGATPQVVSTLPSLDDGANDVDVPEQLALLESAHVPALESANVPVAPTSMMHDVDQRLKVLCTPKKGSVSHCYSSSGMLDVLELASYLKPSADLGKVLAASGNLLFARESQVTIDLRDGKYTLPGEKLLRTSRIRLDLLYLRFQQKLFLRTKTIVYLLVDASPQLGYDFFVARRHNNHTRSLRY